MLRRSPLMAKTTIIVEHRLIAKSVFPSSLSAAGFLLSLTIRHTFRPSMNARFLAFSYDSKRFILGATIIFRYLRREQSTLLPFLVLSLLSDQKEYDNTVLCCYYSCKSCLLIIYKSSFPQILYFSIHIAL